MPTAMPRRRVHECGQGAVDSWAEDAVVDDRAGGQYARPDRIRPINHRGDSTRSPARSTCRAATRKAGIGAGGSSDTGRRFAARHADAVFTPIWKRRRPRRFHAI